MKSREISTRAVAITGILVVLICLGLYLYMRQDTKNFAASLPAVATPVIDPSRASSGFTEDVIDEGFSETTLTEDPVQPPLVTTEELVDAMPNAVAGATEEEVPACEMSEDMMESEPKHYAGMSVPEVRRLLKDLASPNVQDLDEKLAQLEQVLIDRFGPDPKIPEAIDALSTAYTLIELAENANAVGSGNSEEVNAFLAHAPAVVLETLVETSIELLQPSEAEAARARAMVERFRSKVDTIQIYQDMAPMVETAIQNGELSPEEGVAFLESLGDNISVQVDYDSLEGETPREDTLPSEPTDADLPVFFDN